MREGAKSDRVDVTDLPPELRELARTLEAEATALERTYPAPGDLVMARETADGSVTPLKAAWKQSGGRLHLRRPLRAAVVALLALSAMTAIWQLRWERRSPRIRDNAARSAADQFAESAAVVSPQLEKGQPSEPGIEPIDLDDPLLYVSDPELEGTLDWLEQHGMGRQRVGL